MSFVSFPHLVYIVYQIFWEKSNFFGENFGRKKKTQRWKEVRFALITPGHWSFICQLHFGIRSIEAASGARSSTQSRTKRVAIAT